MGTGVQTHRTTPGFAGWKLPGLLNAYAAAHQSIKICPDAEWHLTGMLQMVTGYQTFDFCKVQLVSEWYSPDMIPCVHACSRSMHLLVTVQFGCCISGWHSSPTALLQRPAALLHLIEWLPKSKHWNQAHGRVSFLKFGQFVGFCWVVSPQYQLFCCSSRLSSSPSLT